MKNFIKLKNGNIIFVTKSNNQQQTYHGVNLNSPLLKQINVSFSSVKKGWDVDMEEAEVMLKKSVDISKIYSSHPENYFQKRAKRIVDELVLCGMEPIAYYQAV